MVEERKIIMTEEEEMRWFFEKVLDTVTLEMNKGVYRVIFSKKRRRYELRIYRENNVLFFAEGSSWEVPIRMLEGHIAFLKMVAKTLREASAFFDLVEKARSEEGRKQEEEQEEEGSEE
jgi:hypothetical protein